MSVASENLAVRFVRKLAQLRVANPSTPCLTVRVRGRLLQAVPEASRAPSEWLRLVEPARKLVGQEIQEVNDLLSFAYTVCFHGITVEQLEVPLLSWNISVTAPKILLSGLFKPPVGFPAFQPRFAEVGRPSFGLLVRGITRINGPDIEIDLPLPAPADFPLPDPFSFPDQWTLTLRLPDGSFHVRNVLKFDPVSLTFTVKGPDWPSVPLPQCRLELGFDRRILILPTPEHPGPLTLDVALPDVELPKLDGAVDLSRLKLRIRGPEGPGPLEGFVVTRPIVSIDGPKITLGGPVLDLDPKLVLQGVPFGQLRVDLFLDASLPLSKAFLGDLIGDVPSIDFRLTAPDGIFHQVTVPRVFVPKPGIQALAVPFELRLRIPRIGVEAAEFETLSLWLGLAFDLDALALVANRTYFYLPHAEQTGPQQRVDLDVLTLVFPSRPEVAGPPDESDHDGYFDLTHRELVIDIRRAEVKPKEKPLQLLTFFPGGMSAAAVVAGQADLEQRHQAHEHRRRRPRPGPGSPHRVPPPLPARAGEDLARHLAPAGSERGRLPVPAVQRQRRDLRGRHRQDRGRGRHQSEPGRSERQRQPPARRLQAQPAGPVGRAAEPGGRHRQRAARRDGVRQDVRAGRQGAAGAGAGGAPPGGQGEAPRRRREHAARAARRGADRRAVDRPVPALPREDRSRPGVAPRQRDWDYSATVDGKLSFTGAAALIPDLEALRDEASIEVLGLDLRRMNLRSLNVPIKLRRPIDFEILGGQFGVALADLAMSWEWDFTNHVPIPRRLATSLANIQFKNPGALEVHVGVGGLVIEFDEHMTARIALPSRVSLEVLAGGTVSFAGEVGWVDDRDAGERYFFASGAVTIEGFPPIETLVKLGSVVKLGGATQPNVVIYGAQGLDYELFPGAVLKQLGGGIGVNNRLSVIPPRPSAEEILAGSTCSSRTRSRAGRRCATTASTSRSSPPRSLPRTRASRRITTPTSRCWC